MKLIKVDCCGNCPLKHPTNTYVNNRLRYDCEHTLTDGMSIYDLSKISPDCPLEDVEEEK